jgi:hypothetical protein
MDITCYEVIEEMHFLKSRKSGQNILQLDLINLHMYEYVDGGGV